VNVRDTDNFVHIERLHYSKTNGINPTFHRHLVSYIELILVKHSSVLNDYLSR
jgi:hypothetical protein